MVTTCAAFKTAAPRHQVVAASGKLPSAAPVTKQSTATAHSRLTHIMHTLTHQVLRCYTTDQLKEARGAYCSPGSAHLTLGLRNCFGPRPRTRCKAHSRHMGAALRVHNVPPHCLASADAAAQAQERPELHVQGGPTPQAWPSPRTAPSDSHSL